MGPSAIRIAGLGERLAAMGWTLVDKGNLPVPIAETQVAKDPTKHYIREIARVCQKLYQQVYDAHAAGALPIVLGGDHSLAAGSVGASADYETLFREFGITTEAVIAAAKECISAAH